MDARERVRTQRRAHQADRSQVMMAEGYRETEEPEKTSASKEEAAEGEES